MNTPARPPRLRFAASVAPWLLAALFLARPTVHAQGNSADSNANARAAAARQAFASARSLAKAGNVTAADQALHTSNTAPANTAKWEAQQGMRLLELADQLRGEGRPDLVRGVATAALAHARQCIATTSSAPTLASAHALSGFIHERYFGDTVSALASYQAASSASPNTKSYREAIDRLTRQLAASSRNPRN